MQATVIIECACGQAVGRVSMDTADLNIPGAWQRIGTRAQELLDAHRYGACPVYNSIWCATHVGQLAMETAK